MKCIHCGQNEAAFRCDCLKVRHEVSISTLMNQKEIREQAVGMERIGLCEQCKKKLIKKNLPSLTPGKAYVIALLFFALGILVFFAGVYNSANGGGSIPLQFAGMIVTFTSCILLTVYTSLTVPARLRRKPYRVLGRMDIDAVALLGEGKHDLYVPLGENYYKDEKDFARVNGLLSEDIRKQIYEKLVVTGAWKLADTFPEPESETAGGPKVSLLKDSVDRLLDLYRRRPGGFLTEQAGEVRAVGQTLYEAGGMDLMLRAHRIFQSQNHGMARNLEMVWDGIGSWQG